MSPAPSSRCHRRREGGKGVGGGGWERSTDRGIFFFFFFQRETNGQGACTFFMLLEGKTKGGGQSKAFRLRRRRFHCFNAKSPCFVLFLAQREIAVFRVVFGASRLTLSLSVRFVLLYQ